MGTYGFWLGIALLALIVVSLIIFLVHFRQRKAVQESPFVRSEQPAQTLKETEKPEDLTKIEGIGPKISAALGQTGITTYAQLASTDVSKLRQILKEAGLNRLADPGTWPEQASLAASEKWEELTKLQAELKGGRRV